MNVQQRAKFRTAHAAHFFPDPDKVVAWLRENVAPDDVFSVAQLDAFARGRGFVDARTSATNDSTPPGSGPRVNGKPASTIPDNPAAPLPDGVAGCLGADGRRVRLVGSKPEAELCFDLALAEPQVGRLLAEFGAGRFGFVAMNLSATETLRDLITRAVSAIDNAEDATDDDRTLAEVGARLLDLVRECQRVLAIEHARRRASSKPRPLSDDGK